MAKIRVSNGRFGLRFFEALKKARPGDTLVLKEGIYNLEPFFITDLNIVGVGSKEKIRVQSQVEVRGRSRIANLTLQAPAFHNAVAVKNPDARVDIDSCYIHGEPTNEYPALFCDGGIMDLDETIVYSEKNTIAVFAQNGGTVNARKTGIAKLALKQSRANLEDVFSFQIFAESRSQLNSRGRLEITTEKDQRSLVFLAESVGVIDRLVAHGEPYEGFCNGSLLQIDEVDTGGETKYKIVKEGKGRVDVPHFKVEIQDLDVPQHSSQASAKAKSVESLNQAITPSAELPESPNGGAEEFSELVNAEKRGQQIADPIEELEAFTGLDKVKEQIESFSQMVTFNQLRAQRGLKSTPISMHSLFLGSPGTGKTTVARLLGKILHQSGAIRSDVFIEVGRKDLVSDNIGGSAKLTEQVLESARGGVLFIDEAYSLYQDQANAFSQEAVDTILTFMENNRDEIVVVFAGYEQEMQKFLNMNPGLKSRTPNRFDFEDYTPEQVAEIGLENLKRDEYSVNEQLYRRIVTQKYSHSADKSNARWVRNFNENLIRVMAGRVFRNQENEGLELSRILDEDLHQIVGGDREQRQLEVDKILTELDSMIGLGPVKQWVHRLIDRVQLDQKRMNLDSEMSKPNYHMVFTGNPGTGKTTVAKLIGRLFVNLGIVDTPTVKVVDRADLVGKWIGHTEEKTTNVIDSALGGVLFVDEAYQLSTGLENDFGKQAIETMMTRLEDDRDKFVAIFAGYSDRMDDFLGSNPGLSSRLPHRIEFPDYSGDEVGRIVALQLAKNWTFDSGLLESVVVDCYEKSEIGGYSNGRWARNFVEQLENEHGIFVASERITGEAIRHIDSRTIRNMLNPGDR